MVRIKTNRKSSKAEQAPASPIGRARRLIVQRFRVLVALVVVALLGWGMHSVWQHFEPQISQRHNYLLVQERIQLTPLPEWITGDVRGQAIRNAGIIGRLSVLDEAFAQVIEDA
ncbi:MAG: hypothetical protein ACR2NM_02350, partial [Bythopirellula sp.]